MSTISLLILSLIINACIGLFVYLKNPRSRLNQMLVLLVAAMSEWTIANYLADKPVLTLFWNRATFVGPIFMVLSAYLFALYITGLNKLRLFHKALIIISIIVTGLSLSGLAITGVAPRLQAGHIVGFNPIRGIGYPFVAVWIIILATAAIIVLTKAFQSARGAQREQLRFILLGIAACALLSIFTNIILSLVTDSTAYAKYAPLSTIVLTSCFGYAIVKHRFLDIRSAVARSVTFTLLLLTLGVSYGVITFSISQYVVPSSDSSVTRVVINTILALILAFTFQPLRRFFERITDRVFYRDHYDSQEVLNNFSKILVRELNLERILKHSLENLCESVHIQFGQLVIFNHDRVYRVEHYGPLPQRLMVAPELRTLNRSLIVADELEGGARKALMDRHSIRVSLMLTSRDEFVGYLLLGDKLSGDIYSDQDIELLEIISKELAVAIQNAKAYAEIQEFNINLQTRIEHATNRLRVANRHLKELDRAKDEFISMASHQLRTPLTTIKGYLSMMLEGDAGAITASQKQFVQFAFDASERMVNLISDLLNVSRLSAGRFLIQTKPTDMVKMIEEEVHQLKQHADAKGVQLIFERPPDPLPPVQIDDNKTRQVVMNFIDNAIYYTTHGQVRIKLKQTGGSVRFEVHDTGIGVPDDAKRKLFTKFYRAGNAQTLRPDGTGLGLYLAKRVIHDQGGTIIFSSVEGKGSTFGFELPFKPQPVKHEDTHAHRKPARK